MQYVRHDHKYQGDVTAGWKSKNLSAASLYSYSKLLCWFASICIGDHAAHFQGGRMQTSPLKESAETETITFTRCVLVLCVFISS